LSTLGKILTVMVALVAIAVAVLVAREFVLTRNWEQAYEAQVKITNRVADERATVIRQRDDMKVARDTDRAKFEESIVGLNSKVTERDATINTLREENISQGKKLQELANTYEGFKKSFEFLVAEREGWLKQRDEAVKTADLFTKMYSELVVRYRTDQANIANLKDTLITNEKEIADLKGKITFIAQMNPAVRIPDKGPYPPVAPMNGLVTAVDNAAGMAEINLGSDSGVTPGTVFLIYREPGAKFLAELTIKKVGPKTAAGTLSVIQGTVEVKDHVQNKPGE
jgi:hypothetical protein